MYSLIIVDDEKIYIEDFCSVIPFAKLNIELLDVCCDGEDGFEKISQLRPDIIVCDINMPKISGFEMIEKLDEIQGYSPQIIMFTGYSDFSHAKEAINHNVLDYLVKPCMPSDIIDALKKAVEKCKNNEEVINDISYNEIVESDFINKLIHGDIPKEEIEIQCKKLNINLLYSSYTLLQINLDYKFLRNSIVQDIKEVFNDIYVTTINFNHFYILLCGEYSDLDDKLETILKREKYKNYRICISVSNSVQNSFEIQQMHKDVKYCGQLIFCFNDNRVMQYQKVTDYINMNFDNRHYEEFEQTMREAGEKGSWEDYIAVINSIPYEFEYYPVQYMKTIIYSTLSSKLSEILESGVDTSGDNASTLWTDISSTKSIYELIKICSCVAFECQDMANNSIEYRYKVLSKKMKQYVYDNYMNNISTLTLAQNLYLSDKRLRDVFQQVNGISFTKFVQQYRMQKALELLRLRKYKVYEVAIRVGYNDIKSFRNTFVKFYGKSPSDIIDE